MVTHYVLELAVRSLLWSGGGCHLCFLVHVEPIAGGLGRPSKGDCGLDWLLEKNGGK